MLADTDAGNVVTGVQAGAQWGYRLLPLLLLLIPMLYMVQELTVRLGICTGRGHAELIRERFGVGWAWLSTAGLAAATIGSLVTNSPEWRGSENSMACRRSGPARCRCHRLYRRVERIAIVIGLFELAFFAVAWAAQPSLETLAKDAVDLPLGNREFLFLVAAVIGAVFNPWMIFYQQSATANKRLQPDDLEAARWDTAVGAVLTQCLTGAVLIAAAATLASSGASANIGSVGDISVALSPLLGEDVGLLFFSAGVLGASLVAAIVSSLALAWGGWRGPWIPSLPGISAVRGEVVLWSLCGLRCRCCRPCLVRTGPCVAQYRGASSECFPAAVGDRLPLSVGGENAAGADASAWVLSLDFDRHLRRRHRVGSIWWGLGTAVTTNAEFQLWKRMRCRVGRLCPLPRPSSATNFIDQLRLYIRLASAKARIHPARLPCASSLLARARVRSNAICACSSARLTEPSVG